MPKKAAKEIENFKKVVDLLRRLYKDDRMKILVHPDGIDLKIEEEAIAEYSADINLEVKEIKGIIKADVANILNNTKGVYEEKNIEILLGPPSKKESDETRNQRRETWIQKMNILKEMEPEWTINQRYEAKLKAKHPVIVDARWEICSKLADEKGGSKQDSTPFTTIELRFIEPPFRPTDLRALASLIFGTEKKSISLWCDKEDIHYLRKELEKVEKKLDTFKEKGKHDE